LGSYTETLLERDALGAKPVEMWCVDGFDPIGTDVLPRVVSDDSNYVWMVNHWPFFIDVEINASIDSCFNISIEHKNN
jgi:hypothetical protein